MTTYTESPINGHHTRKDRITKVHEYRPTVDILPALFVLAVAVSAFAVMLYAGIIH